MGRHINIAIDKFPVQRPLGRRVDVCFNYDSSRRIGGTVVRDDTEAPFQTIFKLDDGRYVLATECMYSYTDS